ncbi:hypothetical protein M8C21_001613, partial [Ambrosia artemisiifolia]
DAKARLKWTPELHKRFVDAVTQLGGPEKATPKSLMRVMSIDGLTLYHLKSHLQAGKDSTVTSLQRQRARRRSLQMIIGVISLMSITTMKRQIRLTRYDSSTIEVEVAKVELSQLVSMVDNGCSSSLSIPTELETSTLKHNLEESPKPKSSLESSLTSSESSSMEMTGISKVWCGRKRSGSANSDGCC